MQKTMAGWTNVSQKIGSQVPISQKVTSGLTRQTILAYGPSLYWRLGEAAGASTAIDSSGNSRNGTIGAGVTMGGTGALTNDPNKSASFNDTSTAGVTSAYQPFTNGTSRTIVGWANRAATTDLDMLFSGSVSGGLTALWVVSGGTSMVFRANAASVTWTSAFASAGTWAHFALTYNDSTLAAELFINGVSKGSQSLATGYAGGAGGNFIASGSSSTNTWNGSLQDIAVFESILSASAIAAIAAADTASGVYTQVKGH